MIRLMSIIPIVKFLPVLQVLTCSSSLPSFRSYRGLAGLPYFTGSRPLSLLSLEICPQRLLEALVKTYPSDCSVATQEELITRYPVVMVVTEYQLHTSNIPP